MRIDNSNKRYSNIITGILVVVFVSIFVAFVLCIGDFKTDLPYYISPSGVVSPFNTENEVSKINILGNNEDVSIAKDWQYTASVESSEVIIMPDWLFVDSYQCNYHQMTNLPDWVGVFEDPGNEIPCTINDLPYYFTIAVKGCNIDPSASYITFDQCGDLITIDFEEMGRYEDIAPGLIDLYTIKYGTDLDDVLGDGEDADEWKFYAIWDLDLEETIKFCSDPDILPAPDSFPTPIDEDVDITLWLEFECFCECSCDDCDDDDDCDCDDDDDDDCDCDCCCCDEPLLYILSQKENYFWSPQLPGSNFIAS
ncbi:MAG: hypothetical protein ACXAC5_11040 [Promethearchaeota archaeon]|jgi:hypothetical protein